VVLSLELDSVERVSRADQFPANSWYTQTTTGDRPTRRERFCIVGAPAPNKTYDIFMYGGITTDSYKSSDEVYVLSLPGFVFFKASAPEFSSKRADHTCVLVGRRQLLSVGGIDTDLLFPKNFLDPDPWTNGLGVFDLTSLAWQDRYNVQAASYQPHAAVNEWYSKDGMASVKWSSDAVRKLFTETPPPGTLPDEPSDPNPSSSPPPPPSAPDSDGGGKGLPTRAVVAIAVAGGLIALILSGYGLYRLYLSRRVKHAAKLRDDAVPHEVGVNENWELPSDPGVSELNSPF